MKEWSRWKGRTFLSLRLVHRRSVVSRSLLYAQSLSHFSHVSGLPAPGNADLRGRREQLDVQVPVPPLDLRRGRPFARRAGNGTN